MTEQSQQAVFVPLPESELLDFARLVCQTYAARTGDSRFTDYEVIWGLMGVLRVCAGIAARALNNGDTGLLDGSENAEYAQAE